MDEKTPTCHKLIIDCLQLPKANSRRCAHRDQELFVPGPQKITVMIAWGRGCGLCESRRALHGLCRKCSASQPGDLCFALRLVWLRSAIAVHALSVRSARARMLTRRRWIRA